RPHATLLAGTHTAVHCAALSRDEWGCLAPRKISHHAEFGGHAHVSHRPGSFTRTFPTRGSTGCRSIFSASNGRSKSTGNCCPSSLASQRSYSLGFRITGIRLCTGSISGLASVVITV